MTDQSIAHTTSKDNLVSVSTKKKSRLHPGQPTKYNEEVLTQAKNYLARIKAKDDIPYLSEFASEIDVDRRTVENWADKQGENSEFFRTLKVIKNYQEFCLEKGALVGKYNPTSAIFQLKVNHGKIETEKKDFNHSFGDLTDEQLNTLIKSKGREVGVVEATTGEEA